MKGQGHRARKWVGLVYCLRMSVYIALLSVLDDMSATDPDAILEKLISKVDNSRSVK